MAAPSDGRTLKKADPSTIQNKFLVGYQGWFTCPGDGPPLDPHHHGWLHWFTWPIPDGGRPNTDLWPDVSEYSPSELFAAPGLKFANGDQAFVFSSRNARTVERHFHWMALHGVDGAFLQRFLGQCDVEGGNEAIRNQRDEVGDLVKQAAEKEGRTYAIMYDISGVAPDRIERIIKQDWKHLLHTRKALDSPSYLREKGKAVVTLWGFGMNDNNHDPAMVRRVTAFIRENTPGGAYIVGGSPAYWRTSESDADRNPEWVNVWLEEFDAISPWTVGRFSDLEGVDRFAEWNIKKDWELIEKRNEEAARGVPGRRHIDYIPVVLPGGTGFNLSEGKWSWNGIQRRGGRFLWRELWNIRRLGIRTMYGAMWDEYDEGTAFMPVVSKKRQVPVNDKYNFMALDEDGYDLPPDWYMRIAGFAAEGLRGERAIQETFPSKELDDYWSKRPRYEESSEKKVASGSGGQSWEDWQKMEKEKDDLPPPPPYTLEVDEQAAPPRPRTESRPTVPIILPQIDSRPPQESAPAPPAATRPDTAAPSPSRSPAKPPVPLASRPSVSRPGASSGQQYTGPAAPPVRMNSRPQQAEPGQHFIAALADDFGRQTISSVTPSRLDAPSAHSSRPPSTSPRPISPAQPGTCANELFPGYPAGPSSRPPSVRPPSARPPSANHESSYASSPNAPSFPPHDMSPPQPSSPSSSGPWSQTWPPPEWGARTSSPPSRPQSSFPNPDYGGPSYGSGYMPAYPQTYSPPPPGPAGFPGSQSPPPSHSHSPSPTQSSSNPFAFPDVQIGGFRIPQPDTSYPFGAPPQPHGAPQQYPSYDSGSYAPSFPNYSQSGSSYPPYSSASSPPPPPGPGQYGGYPPGPSVSTFPQQGPTAGHAANSFPPPPQRPPASSYPGQQNGQSQRPPGQQPNPPPRPPGQQPIPPQRPPGQQAGQSQRPPGGPSNSMLGSLGSLGGGRIQSLAQTGLSTGEKLFNKLRK